MIKKHLKIKIEKMQKPDKQDIIKPKRDAKGRLLPGNTANPFGRPAFSIKETIRKHLQDNPQEYKEFFMHFIKENRELAWRMLEGNPTTSVEFPQGINISFDKEFKKKEKD